MKYLQEIIKCIQSAHFTQTSTSIFQTNVVFIVQFISCSVLLLLCYEYNIKYPWNMSHSQFALSREWLMFRHTWWWWVKLPWLRAVSVPSQDACMTVEMFRLKHSELVFFLFIWTIIHTHTYTQGELQDLGCIDFSSFSVLAVVFMYRQRIYHVLSRLYCFAVWTT